MSITLNNGEYFGSISRQMKVNTLLLTETTYKLNAKLPKHEHENDILYFITKGSVNETYTSKTETYTAGDVIINPANHIHSHHFLNSCSNVFNIELDRKWLADLGVTGSSLQKHLKPTGSNIGFNLRKLYKEFKKPDNASTIAIEGLMMETLAEIIRSNMREEKSGMPLWVKRVKELINEEYGSSLSMGYISAAAGVHPVYLSRGFKKFTGTSLSDHIRKVRVEKALIKVKDTSEPLSQISLECGFTDQSHFCKTVKEVTGLSPGRFRQR